MKKSSIKRLLKTISKNGIERYEDSHWESLKSPKNTSFVSCFELISSAIINNSPEKIIN